MLIPAQHWKEKRKQAGCQLVGGFFFASQWGCWIWWFEFVFFLVILNELIVNV
jgi:hypothetical protein